MINAEQKALALAIEEMADALREMVYETTHLSPMEDDGSHRCKISERALKQARAALEARGLEIRSKNDD